jgi:methyl-accepting chemotaxis protein
MTNRPSFSAEIFGELGTQASDAGGLVDHIATASNEQALEIESVNKAVAEVDRVVQQNAVNADEFALALKEMNAHAKQMNDMIDALENLVGGGVTKE